MIYKVLSVLQIVNYNNSAFTKVQMANNSKPKIQRWRF